MTQTILRALLLWATVLAVPASVLAFGLFGLEHALGLAVGALIFGLDGAAIIYFVGQMTRPAASVWRQSILVLVLFLKLGLVFGLVWVALAVLELPGLGVVVGLGLALVALMIAVQRGGGGGSGVNVKFDPQQMRDSATDLR